MKFGILKAPFPARFIRQLIILASAYAIAGHLSLILALAPGFVTPLWPSSGIALAGLLLGGARLWPAVLVGSLLVNIPLLWQADAGIHVRTLLSATAIATGASIQALVANYVLRRPRLADHVFVSNPGFMLALIGSGIFSVFINSSIGSLTLAIGHYIPQDMLGATWVTWYLGDLAGVIIGTPLILAWAQPQLRIYGGRRVEAIAVFCAQIVISALVFYGWGMHEDPRFGGTFLLLPVLAWIALRFGPRGATAVLVVVLGIAVHATASGYGPFFWGPGYLNYSLLLLGLFSTVSSSMTLMLAALQTKQKTTERLLEQSYAELEKIVEGRTRELRESEQRFRALFESSPDAVVVHQNYVVVLVNPVAVRLFGGGSASTLIGRSVMDFVHPDFKDIVSQRIAITSQKGGSVPWLVEKLVALDGSVIDAEVVASNVTWGGHSAIQVVAHDIRERIRTESALRESEAKYRRIVETSEEGIWALDATAHTEFVNTKLVKMLGYSADEMIGRYFGDFLETPDHAIVERHLARFKLGECEQYEVKLRRKNGSLLWAIISASPLMNEKGEITGILKMLTDNTDRKLGAERLEEANSRLKAAFEATADGILVVNHLGKIVGYNHKFLLMWHIPENVIEGGDDSKALAYVLDQLCEPEKFLKKVQRLYDETGESFDVLSFRDGRVFERVSIPQFIGRKVAGRVWSFRDVTDRYRAEAERSGLLERERASREAAERAVHSREEFLSVASHELKTPITSLLFAVQNLDILLLHQENKQPLVANALGIAERQTRRLAGLVNTLLDISRMQSGHLRLEKAPANLKPLLGQVLAELQEEIRRSGCSVSLQANEDIIGDWDAFRIEQVMTNLITNALKYGARKPVEIRLFHQGQWACLAVTDHGIGISPEHRARIFQPFERAASARNYSGLGLGLAIVHSIVTAHGGTVDFESNVGAGSTFRVKLPLGQTVH